MVASLRLTALSALSQAEAGCTDGGSGGCSPPVGEKWDRWDMAGSTYHYCFGGCAMPWIIENSKKYGLGEFGGVVGVDHYYTKQGMPCVNGEPQEFAHQDALTIEWKKQFPTMRFLQYRILSAVPYDMVIQNKILSDQDAVIRWRHQPGTTEKAGNGSVCYNYVSACFNDPKRINDPAHKCSFEIRAASYNWSNPNLADWYVKEVIAPTLKHADGVWLDGIGPDNGAYMCAGVCCGYGASNSPLVQSEIDDHCDAQAKATTQAQKYLIANGGWEAMQCFDYKGISDLPTAKDSAAQCASKLQHMASWATDHGNYNFVVAYGSRTGAHDEYDDSSAEGSLAAFLLMRGQHWLFALKAGDLNPDFAKLVTSDYGKPRGNMTAVPGKANVFQREFEKATVTLDCETFTGKFVPIGPVPPSPPSPPTPTPPPTPTDKYLRVKQPGKKCSDFGYDTILTTEDCESAAIFLDIFNYKDLRYSGCAHGTPAPEGCSFDAPEKGGGTELRVNNQPCHKGLGADEHKDQLCIKPSLTAIV